MRKNRYDRQAVKNQEATGKRGRKADGLIKGRNKDGPQERGRKKEINGVDARRQKDGNTDDNNITSSHRQQANVKTCARPHSDGGRDTIAAARERIDEYLKSDVDRPTGR